MALAKRAINILWDRKNRERIRDDHVVELRRGRDSWNRWRTDHPEVRPLLFGASLRGEDFREFNFCNANLIEADLTGAKLIGANFHEANLGGAKLNGHHTKLVGADFCRTDLYETDLSGADLTNANLQGTQFVRTDFRSSNLTGCTIYGLSAWNLTLNDKTEQKDLTINYAVQAENGKWDKGTFVVDNLEVAQFIFLLLDNKRINNVFNEMTSHAVVIMGRFSPKRQGHH